MNETEVLKLKIAELETKLVADHPEFRTLLREIHKQMLADPEVVTLLAEEEIGIVTSGLMKQTQQTIVAAAASSKKKSMKTMELGLDL